MNTLQDLRDTLDTHAALVHDDPVQATHARTLAVAGRARAVRRRRAASVAGAAALALVALLAPSLLPGDRDARPSDRELIGREAPETLDSYGYGYRFVEGVEGQGKRLSIRVPKADRPRLLAWAADDDEVVVGSPYAEAVWSDRTDFDDFTLIRPEESGRWVLRTDGGRAAFALYELDEQAVGVELDDAVIRERVAGEELVDVVVGEPGQTDLSLDLTLPEGNLRVSTFCDGVSGELWANTSFDDDGPSGSGGCNDGGFDPTSSAGAYFDEGELGEPGDTVSIRTWVSRKFDGEPLTDPGARLAIAVYERAEPVATLGGWHVAPLYEHGGHTWRFVDVVRSAPGERALRVENTTGRPVLVEASFRVAVRSTVLFRAGPDHGVDHTVGGGSGSGITAVLRPDGPAATLTVRGERPLPADGELGFALYERVD